MTRREFVGAGLAAGGLALPSVGRADATETAAAGGGVRFCLFADIHYSPHGWPNDNLEWLQRILDRADRERADFVLHLGDFCHHPLRDHDYVDLYNGFKLPTYHTIGNHDDDSQRHEQTLEAYRMKKGYYFIDRGGWRIVVLDLNYFENPETKKCEHYNLMNYLKAKGVTKHVVCPPEELEWLRDVLDRSPYPCVIASHQTLERDNFGTSNWLEVRRVFEAANERHAGRVKMAMNGHFHVDNQRIINNILYWDVNSASYMYYQKTHSAYPADFIKTHPAATHAIAWQDPLSAIVTLGPDGRITVKGTRSKYFLGVTPYQAGLPYRDIDGRTARPEIQSFDLTLHA